MTIEEMDDDPYLEERLHAPSVYVRIVEALPDGGLLLACGHVVRRRSRASAALCEHCFPLHHARACGLASRTR